MSSVRLDLKIRQVCYNSLGCASDWRLFKRGVALLKWYKLLKLVVVFSNLHLIYNLADKIQRSNNCDLNLGEQVPWLYKLLSVELKFNGGRAFALVKRLSSRGINLMAWSTWQQQTVGCCGGLVLELLGLPPVLCVEFGSWSFLLAQQIVVCYFWRRKRKPIICELDVNNDKR